MNNESHEHLVQETGRTNKRGPTTAKPFELRYGLFALINIGEMLLHTLRTYTVAKLRFAMPADVPVELNPSFWARHDFFAVRADGQDAAKGLDFVEGLLQVQTSGHQFLQCMATLTIEQCDYERNSSEDDCSQRVSGCEI